jgi:hypothetical protein
MSEETTVLSLEALKERRMADYSELKKGPKSVKMWVTKTVDYLDFQLAKLKGKMKA